MIAGPLDRRHSHNKESASTVHSKDPELSSKSETTSSCEVPQFEFDEEDVLSTSHMGQTAGGSVFEDSKTESTQKCASGGLVNKIEASNYTGPALRGRLEDCHLTSSMEMKKPVLQRRLSADQAGSKGRPEGLTFTTSHRRPISHPPVVNEGRVGYSPLTIHQLEKLISLHAIGVYKRDKYIISLPIFTELELQTWFLVLTKQERVFRFRK